jgi:hypothetical protein
MLTLFLIFAAVLDWHVLGQPLESAQLTALVAVYDGVGEYRIVSKKKKKKSSGVTVGHRLQ